MSYTAVLWTVTAIDVLIAAVLVWTVTRKESKERQLTPDEREQLDTLLRMNERDE